MEDLLLVRPGKGHELDATEYINEFHQYLSDMNGSGGLHKYIGRYNEWLIRIGLAASEDSVPKGKVPASTFFVVRTSDKKIVGMVNIRHWLNDELLKESGHIGYAIRPTERMKGYATKALALALDYLKQKGVNRVLLTCDKPNIASAKTIQANGGILENEIIGEKGIVIQRYWIVL